ncbi:MAG: TonB-dependent receptor plug domain-containing protein [Terracidiphilus sp.]|jgi:iron complex outermembrane receptor protein/vitamin B12 transporter
MSISAFLRTRLRRALPPIFTAILLSAFGAVCPAASIHGVVTDASGAKVTGANVVLVSNGKVVATAVSTADGSFQILTGATGRFFLVVSAKSFRQLETPGFYAGQLDNIERNLVLEPEWVRESIVVTATGSPTPQPQTSAATSVLGPLDLALRDDFVSALRLMPGTFMVQDGQLGAQTALFVRGGNSNANKILLDGVSVDDMGGQFDFGPLSTTAIERAEVYRGPDSNLYGADAGSGVVSLTTPRGTTSFPSILFQSDAGNFNTSREELEVAGSHNKFDYLGAFSWLQTGNALPMDEYHVATTAANVGWQLSGTTQIRATLHYGVDATGVPNAWDFYHVTDDATQKDQDLFVSASIDNQTTAAFHNTLRYGLTRKREQYTQWAQQGSGDFDAYGDSLGDLVTITGANGYSVTGQAILDYAGTYPSGDQYVNNRDQLVYQGDYRFTPHLTALIGFHYEDERGSYVYPLYGTDDVVERTNYEYLASVHGDFKSRFFYTLGGSLEKNSLFGIDTSPRAGVSYYALRPRQGIFSGTRILFNYGDGVREPSLDDQVYSLYTFLATCTTCNGVTPQQLHIGPLAAPATRTYEGGLEQAFLDEHLIFRTSYFHNQFGKEIESVPAPELLNLIPGLTAADLGYYYTDDIGLDVNTQAFRAQGVETTVDGGIGKNIFLRGGYTYLDAVVQRSFDSDNVALTGGYAPTFGGIPMGAFSPLVGARPFRRAPHTGFFAATYAERKLTTIFTSAFASRSDDSTFLFDANYGDTLLLPNRNLDHGYAKLDLGTSYSLLSWLGIYSQGENLLSEQHIAPIGYPSLPMTIRMGLKIQWGPGSSH